MRPDVVCFYTDLGKGDYLPLIERMCKSAKRVMDCRTVLLSPDDNPDLRKLFDVQMRLQIEVNDKNLCAMRARSTVTWQIEEAKEPAFYVDPDLVFLREPPVSPVADVTVPWRSRPDQPINSGFIIAKPGAHEFWKRYGSAAVALPKPLDAWWCDQLAFNLVIGAAHEAGDFVRVLDAIVKIVDVKTMCAKPNEVREDSWTVHYKGKRKWNLPSPEKSGVGKSSPVSASSMDTVTALS